MNELDRLQNAFLRADAMAQEGNAQAAEDARAFAQEIRRLQASGRSGRNPNGFMGQVNKGIANTIGGAVDFVNPLDNLGVTGSAVEGLESGMRAIKADVATKDPETITQSFGRGFGNAAATVLPIAKGLQGLSKMGGAVGQWADDAFRALTTIGGAATEATAGGVGRSASFLAQEAGAPEWVQQTAEIAAPAVALPALTYAARRGPTALAMRAGGQYIAREMAPYTATGAREVARTRMQELAGGQQRATELAGRIRPETEIGLTPAQQTGDPNMLAIEQTAMQENPALRDRIERGIDAAGSQARAQTEAMGGDTEAAQAFLRDRRAAFTAQMQSRIDQAMRGADAQIEGVAPRTTTGDNSVEVRRRVENAFDEAKMQEDALYAAIPADVTVPTSASRAAAQAFIQQTPRAQREDIPKVILDLLGADTGFQDAETVAEMRGLYSKLREVARSAMAGTNQQRNTARIANGVADAILEDLGATAGETAVGRQINEARAFSAAMHETFDQGAVGRILKRTLDGDTTIEPETALDRTVRAGGNAGAVSSRQITQAAPNAGQPIQDYLRGRFMDAAQNPMGDYDPRAANKFLRDNRETLAQYPDLNRELRRAVGSRASAEAFMSRNQQRIAAVNDPRQSAGAAFLNGTPEQAAQRIIGAQDPARAARSLVAEARKDPTGQALAGVKGAFTRYLIQGADVPTPTGAQLSGTRMAATLRDPATMRAMRVVFAPEELSRLGRIANEVQKLTVAGRAAPDIGGLSGAKPNRLIEYFARVIAARQGAAAGAGSGASLQTAGMASENMRRIMGSLTNDKASQILMDAVEDPDLFRALLLDPASVRAARRIEMRLAPYFAGAVSSAASED